MKQLIFILIFGLASCASPIKRIYHVEEYRAIKISKKNYKKLEEITGKDRVHWSKYVGAYWVYSNDTDGQILEQSHLNAEFVHKFKK